MNFKEKKNLESNNPIYILFFSHIVKVLKLGSKKIFEKEDLWKIDDGILYSKHKKKFQKYLKKKKNKNGE